MRIENDDMNVLALWLGGHSIRRVLAELFSLVELILRARAYICLRLC